MEEINNNVQIKYSSYTPAQKRATQKYRENNKDKVNEQRKKYYQNRKERDPEFLEYKRTKAKEYYQLKKQAQVVQTREPPEEIIADIPQPAPLIPFVPTPELVCKPEEDLPNHAGIIPEEEPPNHCSPPDLIIRKPKVKMTIKKTIKSV
jgi:hypothetical protein